MATPIPKNRAAFDLETLARITGGRLVGRARDVRGITTDSRAVAPGELFVALRGESFDGHRFVPKALDDGAGAVLVSDPASIPADATGVVVDDTLEALGALAREHRRVWGKQVVGITGSAGKTTTKELLRGALEAAGRSVHATRGNLNNRVGVPMTLFELDDSHDVAVVEMGTSEAGEIAKLAAIGEPDVALVTSIGLSHAAGLGDVEDVAHEKGALFRALGARGVAVVNLDDPRVVVQAGPRPNLLTYGRDAQAHYRLLDATLDERGGAARIAFPGQREPRSVRLAIPSTVAALNATGALAALAALGIDPEAGLPGLADVVGVEGRMRPHHASNGALILDDTYNANPRSMAASIESAGMLAKARAGRLVLVLGEMKELGPHAEAAHAALGREAAASGASRLVGVGPAMVHAVEQASSAGVSVAWVADAAEAAAAVERLAPEDVVLVKGSRSMRMERAVAALLSPEKSS